jgi:SAM-dependent methyltransferase
LTDDARFARFESAYAGDTPPAWDSGIVPPEVRALVEGDAPLLPGHAVDVGCGTGVSSVYLAANGWQVTGVDWVEAALTRAQARALAAGLSPDNPRFVRADASTPSFLPAHPALALWLDIGCLHGFSAAGRAHYAGHAARLVAPGGTLLLYAFGPIDLDGQAAGLTQAEVEALFSAAFTLTAAVHGREATDDTRPSAWYTLRRR